MGVENLIYELMLIFFGAAVVGTLFLYIRQPILIAYIFVGCLAGPSGFAMIKSAEHLQIISEVGIILLLFLLGLDLGPKKLGHLFKKTSLVTLGSALLFLGITVAIMRPFGFSWLECGIAGAALMFSSTVISLKLLPTTDLHNQYIGELMISILLMQDILAILMILLVTGAADSALAGSLLMVAKLLVLALAAVLGVKYVLLKLLARFDTIHEYVFLVALGWCFFISKSAHTIGLSYEIGAFLAGISLAISPIAIFIAERLHTVRDFFLILFFFSIGAQFDFHVMGDVAIPGLLLAGALLILKPLIFHFLLDRLDVEKHRCTEVGIRLGQCSEFSLLLAAAAAGVGKISESCESLVQLTTLITFIISTYWVVMRYPTPVGVDSKLRRD